MFKNLNLKRVTGSRKIHHSDCKDVNETEVLFLFLKMSRKRTKIS